MDININWKSFIPNLNNLEKGTIKTLVIRAFIEDMNI